MPFRYEFDPVHKILLGKLEGVVDEPALDDFYRAAGQYVAKVNAVAAIADLSGVTTFQVSSDAIRRLAKSATALPDPMTPRYVVAASPFVFGLIRMFQLTGDSARPTLKVVHSLEEAFSDLGISDARFESLDPPGPSFGETDAPRG